MIESHDLKKRLEIIAKLKSSSLDNGTKFMPPSNLEFTKMNVDNLSENVVPQYASAKFNVRFNSKHKSSSLKKKLNILPKKYKLILIWI